MSVDYKFIADNDPSGDLEAAFATMSAETVSTKPKLPLTYTGIADKTDVINANLLASRVSASLPDWIHDAMKDKGLDINNPKVQVVISDSLGLSDVEARKILDAGIILEPKYGGNFKIGHLSNARQARIDGRK